MTEKREYRSILETDLDEFDFKDDKKKETNNISYNDLLLATTDDVSFDLVDESGITTFPDGDVVRTA